MYKAPREKLACILNCCKVITNLLHNAAVAANENPPGADEFLPVLIYVTIKVSLTLFSVVFFAPSSPELADLILVLTFWKQKDRLTKTLSWQAIPIFMQ